MNAVIQSRVERIRAALQNDPDGITIGDLPPGCSMVPPALRPYQQYADFLRLSDGARCGGIDFFTAEDSERVQYVVVSLPGGHSRWLAIGQLLYTPLLLEKHSQVIHEADPDDPTALRRSLGTVDEFLEQILGPGYLDVLEIQEDRWLTLLQELHLA